jgi:hypothetical protein
VQHQKKLEILNLKSNKNFNLIIGLQIILVEIAFITKESESLLQIKKRIQNFLKKNPMMRLYLENILVDIFITDVFDSIKNLANLAEVRGLLTRFETLIFYSLFTNTKNLPKFSDKYENLMISSSYSAKTIEMLARYKKYSGVRFSFISAKDIILEMSKELIYDIPDSLPDSKFKKMVLNISPKKVLLIENSPISYTQFDTFLKSVVLEIDILSEEYKMGHEFLFELIQVSPDFLNSAFNLIYYPDEDTSKGNSTKEISRIYDLEEKIKFGRIDLILNIGGRVTALEISGYNKTHSSDQLKDVSYEDSVFSDFLRMYSLSVGDIPSFTILTDIKKRFIEYKVIFYPIDLVTSMKNRGHGFSELYFYCQNPFRLVFLEEFFRFQNLLAREFNVNINYDDRFFNLIKSWKNNKKEGFLLEENFGGSIAYSARTLYFQRMCKDFLDLNVGMKRKQVNSVK